MLKKVIGKTILLEPDPMQESTPGGLYIPTKAGRSVQKTGRVVLSNIDEIKIGERVVIKPYSETRITYEEKVYFVVKECNILGKVTS